MPRIQKWESAYGGVQKGNYSLHFNIACAKATTFTTCARRCGWVVLLTQNRGQEKGKAADKALKAKQETKRMAREVKRRATMHASPSAKVMLEKLKQQGVITPTKAAGGSK